MIKQTLSHGVKILKISTWISVIVSLFIIAITAFLVAFPNLIKEPIETQLSDFSGLDIQSSKIRIDFDKGILSLNVYDLEVNSAHQKIPMASFSHLRWDVHLQSWFEDVYHPSEIYIDTLALHPETEQTKSNFSVNDLRAWLSPESFGVLSFFKLLHINKTLIKTEQQTFEVSPLLLSLEGPQISLKIADQDLDFDSLDLALGKADIFATFSIEQSERDQFLTFPTLIKHKDFSLVTQVKLFNEKGEDFIESSSYLDQIQQKYLPLKQLSQETQDRIKRSFIAGSLHDLKFNFKKNLSTDSAPETQFSVQLKGMELKFDEDWESVKNIDATLTTDGHKVVAEVDSITLNGMAINDIKVQILDLSQEQQEVEVFGKLDTQSQDLIDFLRFASLSQEAHEVINQFTLEGKIQGDVKFVVPLDEREVVLDIDLNLTGNRFTVLDDAVVVENYTSTISFHDNEISTVGTGTVQDRAVSIRINPEDRPKDDKATFAVELIDDDSGFKAYVTQRDDESWRANIESETVEGVVEITLSDEDNPRVVLSDIHITTLDSTEESELDIQPGVLPSMYLSTNGIFVNEEQLPDMSVDLFSHDNVLDIHNLKFEGVGVGDEDLIFNGLWIEDKTRLYAQAHGSSLEKFLKNLKIKEKVTGGAFDFDVRLSCNCVPWDIDYQDLTGYVEMNVQKGVFTEENINVAQVFSLLNIETIIRRFKFDVDDIASQGFAYDSIEAGVNISDALIKIDKFELEATSGTVKITGQANIIDETQDLIIKVTPAVGDAVPVSAALAGAGIAGLGVWLLDEVLFDGELVDSVVSEAIDTEYSVTGTWDDPIIE